MLGQPVEDPIPSGRHDLHLLQLVMLELEDLQVDELIQQCLELSPALFGDFFAAVDFEVEDFDGSLVFEAFDN